jgi:putative DNA primase/helicase
MDTDKIPAGGGTPQAGLHIATDSANSNSLDHDNERVVVEPRGSGRDVIPLLNRGVAGVTGVQGSHDEASSVTRSKSGGEAKGPNVPPEIPKPTECPTFRVFDDKWEQGTAEMRPGVYYFTRDSESVTHVRICSPLHVKAVSFDEQDNNFGRLLRFKNTLGHWHEWAMPMELLRGSGEELRGELLAMGVEIDPTPKARNLLASYLQDKPPKRQMRCALQVGWCDESFVLPDKVFGPKASGVVFQSGERGHEEYTQGGTIEGWQSEISTRAIGNPMLTLSLSVAFAGPLLARCNAESGGIHLVGDSSTGKTTLLAASCSVWGGPNFRRSWRATANGMEGAASLFNDGLLALDEISECNAREVGAIVYTLGNGRGKQRANRNGNARGVTRFRCMVLSNGERTIATSMEAGGDRAKAGQAVRLLDVPVRRTLGAWDNLDGFANGAELSDAILRASKAHYGHAGRAFLKKLTRDNRNFCAMLDDIKARPEFAVNDGEGQEKRAAARFAQIALAGELATEYGITGWAKGDAIKAASKGFKAWQSLRGRGNDERRRILEQVSDFIDKHGDSRFSDVKAESESQIRDRAGWWEDLENRRIYRFTPSGMRDATKGYDFEPALDVLQQAGALLDMESATKRSKPKRIKSSGNKTQRVYTIDPEKLGEDHGAEKPDGEDDGWPD